jgi:ferredoxin-type protein NapH
MKLTGWRRLCQLLALGLIVLLPTLNKKGISWASGTFYSMAFGPVWITDPLIGLQTILTGWTADGVLLLSMLIPFGVALIFGRVFCGWLCPQNTISELVDFLGKKIGLRQLCEFKPKPHFRYAILGLVLVATALAGLPLASLLSAPGIISVQAAKLVYEGTVGLELGLIGLIVGAELFLARRVWCNHLCPVGSFLCLFRWRKTLKVVMNEDAEHPCGHCLACAKACQLGLNPLQEKIYPLCHNCGACLTACEEIKGSRKPLKFRF